MGVDLDRAVLCLGAPVVPELSGIDQPNDINGFRAFFMIGRFLTLRLQLG